VLAVIFDYSAPNHRPGNSLGYLKIRSRTAFQNLVEAGAGRQLEFGVLEARSPDGHLFRVLNDDAMPDVGPLASLCLSVSSLQRSLGERRALR
jgi:hypothetical protein